MDILSPAMRERSGQLGIIESGFSPGSCLKILNYVSSSSKAVSNYTLESFPDRYAAIQRRRQDALAVLKSGEVPEEVLQSSLSGGIAAREVIAAAISKLEKAQSSKSSAPRQDYLQVSAHVFVMPTSDSLYIRNFRVLERTQISAGESKPEGNPLLASRDRLIARLVEGESDPFQLAVQRDTLLFSGKK